MTAEVEAIEIVLKSLTSRLGEIRFKATPMQLKLVTLLWEDVVYYIDMLANTGHPCATCGLYVDINCKLSLSRHGKGRCESLQGPTHKCLDTIQYDIDGGRLVLVWYELSLDLPLPSRAHAAIYSHTKHALYRLAKKHGASSIEKELAMHTCIFTFISEGSTTLPSFSDDMAELMRRVSVIKNIEHKPVVDPDRYLWKTSFEASVFDMSFDFKCMLRRVLAECSMNGIVVLTK